MKPYPAYPIHSVASPRLGMQLDANNIEVKLVGFYYEKEFIFQFF